MSAATIAVEVLVWLTVATCLVCCIGIVVMESFYERLHYMAPVSTIATVTLLIAIVITRGWGQEAIKMSLITLLLFLMNAVLTHASARAARVHQYGQWQPTPEEHIPGMEEIPAKSEPRKKKRS